jgi:hypothetical protein
MQLFRRLQYREFMRHRFLIRQNLGIFFCCGSTARIREELSLASRHLSRRPKAFVFSDADLSYSSLIL